MTAYYSDTGGFAITIGEVLLAGSYDEAVYMRSVADLFSRMRRFALSRAAYAGFLCSVASVRPLRSVVRADLPRLLARRLPRRQAR